MVKVMKVGDRVKMLSSIVSRATGLPFGWVHGKIQPWPERGPDGMIVEWEETGLVTALPNPNVFLDNGKRD
jgi:hypothetical protein